ncbi:hypothetical protein CVT25_014267 [Psilocybe cyanescens]|uniref:Uncharacterized protein n=1 Tax=Psilocybe cyanescens TaxID=93625 RepID=A0A409VPB3_PSICY|nr:hypothetical protein CVT25_014267 [Psilocybe cyanescens]
MTSGRNALNLVAEEEATLNYQDTINQVGPQNGPSPIMASLPLDIVSEIFLTACADPNQELYDTSRLPVQFLIGEICKAWREFAWSTPRLWRNVRITLSEERFDVQKCLLEEWIKRSSDCPLDLQIDISYSSSPWEPLSDAFCVIAETLAQREPFRLPLLKYRKLRMVPQSSNESTQLKWNFEDAPRLQSLNTREGTPKGLLASWANLPCPVYFIEKFALHARWSIPHAEHTEPEFVLLLATPGFKPSCKSFNLRQILEQYHYAILEKIKLALGFLYDEDAGAETWTAAILRLAKRSSFNLVAFSVQQQYE